jgi:hypothetical protein
MLRIVALLIQEVYRYLYKKRTLSSIFDRVSRRKQGGPALATSSQVLLYYVHPIDAIGLTSLRVAICAAPLGDDMCNIKYCNASAT